MKYVLFCLFFTIFMMIDNIYSIYKMSTKNEDVIYGLILGDVVTLIINGIGIYFLFTSGVV